MPRRTPSTVFLLLISVNLLAACSDAPATSGKPKSFEGTVSGLEFSPPRGLFDSPVEVTVRHGTATTVRYTLDSSDPRSSPTAISTTLPLVLHIDPSSEELPQRAPAVIVRATIGGSDALPGSVVTHSYVFPGQVVALSPHGERPGPSWPAPGSGQTRQAIDYGIDLRVAGATEYAAEFDAGLRSIPTLSLVTELSNLFDASEGIYVNARGDGAEWERWGSVELLNPDGTLGFQANTGVRIRGGFSRKPQNPKHAFRLFFRGEHGTKKLQFPLFGKEGANEFDKVDLRTAQNYSWSGDSGTGDQMTMTRDVFSRDLQGVFGRPYTRSRAYHLYLDGVYWGIYQTEERPEARFAETYLGGDPSDYDVIKPERADSTGEVVATDGTLDAWNALWSLCEAGFADDAAFYRLEGKSAAGNRDTQLPVYVDIDNLIDYMLVIYFTANFDGPASKWFSNRQANNFYAIRNRMSADRGFVFLAHDNEHSLHARPITITTGVDENRVSIGDVGGATDGNGRPSEAYRMTVTDVRQFNPQWLHFRLTENALYRERFARRARELLDGDGALSANRTRELHQRRVAELDSAIVVESARWGDAQSPSRPRTKRDHFEPAVRRLEDEFLTKRGAILIEQLREAGLY
jgi:hypothetical protein